MTSALSVNAATAVTSTNAPGYTVVETSYKTSKGRDPFTVPGQPSLSAKQAPGSPMVFRLDGILYQSNDPAASVNGTLVRLNKVVTISTGGQDVKVKAVEITREKVVLEANGQKVELKITSTK